jgi:hypothetical protein
LGAAVTETQRYKKPTEFTFTVENAIAALAGSLLIAAPFAYWLLGGPHA